MYTEHVHSHEQYIHKTRIQKEIHTCKFWAIKRSHDRIDMHRDDGEIKMLYGHFRTFELTN